MNCGALKPGPWCRTVRSKFTGAGNLAGCLGAGTGPPPMWFTVGRGILSEGCGILGGMFPTGGRMPYWLGPWEVGGKGGLLGGP